MTTVGLNLDRLRVVVAGRDRLKRWRNACAEILILPAFAWAFNKDYAPVVKPDTLGFLIPVGKAPDLHRTIWLGDLDGASGLDFNQGAC